MIGLSQWKVLSLRQLHISLALLFVFSTTLSVAVSATLLPGKSIKGERVRLCTGQGIIWVDLASLSKELPKNTRNKHDCPLCITKNLDNRHTQLMGVHLPQQAYVLHKQGPASQLFSNAFQFNVPLSRAPPSR